MLKWTENSTCLRHFSAIRWSRIGRYSNEWIVFGNRLVQFHHLLNSNSTDVTLHSLSFFIGFIILSGLNELSNSVRINSDLSLIQGRDFLITPSFNQYSIGELSGCHCILFL